MANEKGMSDEKKARLEAIRAAKRAQGGDAAPAAQPAAEEAAQTPIVAAATASTPAATGANMPDDKKARLEAIRAAKRAQAGDAAAPAGAAAPTPATPAPAAYTGTTLPGAAPASTGTTLAAAPRPAAASTAPAARPAQPAARPAAKPVIVEEDRIPAGVHLRRAIIGAVFGVILCGLLATMTGRYITAAIWGLVLGALGGILVLNWPPERTTGD